MNYSFQEMQASLLPAGQFSEEERRQLRSPREVFKILTGTAPHPATICRWSLRGSRGVILKTWMYGSKRMCNLDAGLEFIAATTAATTPDLPPDADATNAELRRELGMTKQ